MFYYYYHNIIFINSTNLLIIIAINEELNINKRMANALLKYYEIFIVETMYYLNSIVILI